MCKKMVARWRSCKTVRGEDFGKFREKVGDTLLGGEESSSERRRQWRRRGKAHRRRRAAKNLLVGLVQKKIVMAEKICPEDWDGDMNKLKKPLKTAGTKTKRNNSGL